MLVSLFWMPLFFSRYLLVVSGLFLLLVSLGMGMLPGKYLPWIAAGLFAVLNVFTIRDIYTQYFNHPMRQLVEKLDGAIQPNDLILTSDSYSLGPAFYYLATGSSLLSEQSLRSAAGETCLNRSFPRCITKQTLPELLAAHDTFWYITCNSGGSMPIFEVLHGAVGWEAVGAPVRALEHYPPIMFSARKYVYKP